MDELLARLRARPAGVPALVAPHASLDGPSLAAAAERFADELAAMGARVLATLLDNGPAWVIADLAAMRAGVVHLPIPAFFTRAQREHALRATGCDTLLASEALQGFDMQDAPAFGDGVKVGHRRIEAVSIPAGTAKITFTSGTTGTPKGVCLASAAMLSVAQGLADALAPVAIERHLAALPLAVLLENVAGVYAPLWRGMTVVLPPLADVGLSGSSSFDPARLDHAVRAWRANSVITLPQMLRMWTAYRAASGAADAGSLRIVAVGGAAAGVASITAARRCGLPAYEGYGLSEGASVQTLNLPDADRPGSVGRALPHARLRVAADGEIEIAGPTTLGYLGEPSPRFEWWPTGDLGEIDAEGFVHVRGRKKHVLVTGFGRNVSPEWVETALRSQPAILQAVVYGDGEPALSAVLWPARHAIADAALASAVDAANATLPDYARVAHWLRATVPFSFEAGTATPNGRPLRVAVHELHSAALAVVNEGRPMSFHQQLQADTAPARAKLTRSPIIQATLQGEVSIESYLAFLTEAYHHVRHTVPLLRACRARLPERLAWMRPAVDRYIDEETGHDGWILADIAASGGDPEAVQGGMPCPATELMVAYAYDTVHRGNPVGFFGMVHVLEGTSVALALQAADCIQRQLALPDNAFSYLRSHGTLDREHTQHLAQLLDALDDARDRDAVRHAAQMFYRLYGDVFRSLPLATTHAVAA
jgi:long-subunit acyl-CoA synthetase (AMP-forming)/pyrroloquinoline quinone (PQQ) biosynthesis protein C